MPGDQTTAPENVAADLRNIRLVVLDVDGVLTDGRLYYGADGEALKVFHVRDGVGLKALLRAGFTLAVISGRDSPAVSTRCRELGITHVQQGCENKLRAFEKLLADTRMRAEQALCIVDDTTDLELMHASGYSVAVADAHPEVLAIAQGVTTVPGGLGAVREVCDLLLSTNEGRA